MNDVITCPHCEQRIPSFELWCPVCESRIEPLTDEEKLQQMHVIKPFVGILPKKVAQK